MSQGFTRNTGSTAGFANAPVNTNVTSMIGLTGTLQAPTGITSSAGLNLLGFNYIASAVNYMVAQNNTTTQNPSISAFGTDTNITLQLTGKGTGGIYLSGTRTNDNAASFQVGEYVTSNIPSGSAISIAVNAPADITSISLTAGDWDVYGNVNIVTASVGGFTSLIAWTNTVSATLVDASKYGRIASSSAIIISGTSVATPFLRVSIASTTTVYLSTFITVASGTATACGSIYARRVR